MSVSSELLSTLRRLELAWEEEYEDRALGGIRASSGFRYQYLTALLDLVRAWLDSPTPDQARPELFVEKLSDAVRIEDGLVLATQVKRTRSRARVREALEEFWIIDDLALRRTPELAPRLRFRVLASRAAAGNVSSWIERWRPEEDVEDTRLAAFKARLTTEVAPSPEDRLLTLLVNELSAPPIPSASSIGGSACSRRRRRSRRASTRPCATSGTICRACARRRPSTSPRASTSGPPTISRRRRFAGAVTSQDSSPSAVTCGRASSRPVHGPMESSARRLRTGSTATLSTR